MQNHCMHDTESIGIACNMLGGPIIPMHWKLNATLFEAASCLMALPVAPTCRTARPKSEMQQERSFFTRMFLLFRSLCAIPGFI